MIMISGSGLSQKYHTTSNRALNAYSQAKQEYDFFFFDKAEALLKEAIKSDERFYEAYMLLGELTFNLKRYSESAGFYQKAVLIDSLFINRCFSILPPQR